MKTAASTSSRTAYRDWTKGSVLRNLLYLCWPMLISDGLNMLGPTIDMLLVGRLGAADIAGVGVAGLILNIVHLGIMGVNTGLRALIGRLMGSGDVDGAKYVGRQALVLSISYATLMAAILIFLATPILNLFGMEADVTSEGSAYLKLVLISTIPISVHMMTEAVMQASGDSVTPMKISFFMRITHLCLAPFLIFGLWIFPNLGVRGAGLTNIISACVGMSSGLFMVFSGRTRLRFTLVRFRVDFRTMGRILRIGIPSSISSAQRSFATVILMWFITPFGTLAVASYSLLSRIQQFASLTNAGFGRASGVLVSQNLGAKQPERSAKSAWLAIGISEGIILTLSILMAIWSQQTIRIFTTDNDLINFASILLKIMILGYAVTGCQTVLVHSLLGAGDTISAMIIDLISTWVITLPLAYVLSRLTSLGMYGIWWAFSIGTVLSATTYVSYFRIGRWKRKVV